MPIYVQDPVRIAAISKVHLVFNSYKQKPSSPLISLFPHPGTPKFVFNYY